MSRGRTRFKQNDLKKALKACKAAGVQARITIDTNGKLCVEMMNGSVDVSTENPSAQLDAWLRRKGDTDARSA